MAQQFIVIRPLFVAEGAHGVDSRGAVRRDEAGAQRHSDESQRRRGQTTGSEPFSSNRSDSPSLPRRRRPPARWPRRPRSSSRPAQHHTAHLRRRRPQRHPQADLARALRHRVGQHAVEPDRRQQRGQAARTRPAEPLIMRSRNTFSRTCCGMVRRFSTGRFASSSLTTRRHAGSIAFGSSDVRT